MDAQAAALGQQEEAELAALADAIANIPDEVFAELDFGMEPMDFDWFFPIIEHHTINEE